jgi:hypothetical protein
MNEYFNLAFYVYFANSLLLDIVMSSMVNIFFMGHSAPLAILHHVVSVIALGLFLTLVYRVIKIMIDYEQKKKDKVEGTHVKTKFKSWLFLRVPVREDAKLFSRFTPEAYMVHDVLLCIILVVFNGHSTV